MAAITYSKQMFIERIKKHVANGFPHTEFNITDNEILLYIDEAIPATLKGQMYENAKVTGVIDIPEAYLVTYALDTLLQSNVTGEYYGILPQTPMELPTGYDITDVYFSVNGARAQSCFPVTAKRNTYRRFMPKPTGVFYRVEGSTIYFQTIDGYPLTQQNAYVQMPISRTSDKTTMMNLPDGAIEPIFTKVVARILQRLGIPQDIIKDGLPAGNKNS